MAMQIAKDKIVGRVRARDISNVAVDVIFDEFTSIKNEHGLDAAMTFIRKVRDELNNLLREKPTTAGVAKAEPKAENKLPIAGSQGAPERALEKIVYALSLVDDFPDDAPESGKKWARSVDETLRSISETIETYHVVSQKQIKAIENITEALEKWMP